jgi:hypothetical protein
VLLGPNRAAVDSIYFARDSAWADVPGLEPVSLMAAWIRLSQAVPGDRNHYSWKDWYPKYLQYLPSGTTYYPGYGSGKYCSNTAAVSHDRFTEDDLAERPDTDCGSIYRICKSLPGKATYYVLPSNGAIPESPYQKAHSICLRNFDYSVESLPYYGWPGDHPTSIGRTWREFPDITTPDGITLSDSTIAARITPIMWCPVALNHQAFVSVELSTAPGLGSNPIAICDYADGSQAAFDTRISGSTRLSKVQSSPHAIVLPYNAQDGQGNQYASPTAE